MLELVVANLLRSHIFTHDIFNVSQSAFKKVHATETGLLIYIMISTITFIKVSALNVFDLSTTFDTSDHHILIRRLSTWYYISDTALSWISSYLTERLQAIKIGNSFFSYTEPSLV